MLKEAFWGSRVVFFGEADHGKSTLMGYLYAESQRIDMERHDRDLEEDLGREYKPDYLYSSLINPIVPDSQGGAQRFNTRNRHLRDFVVAADSPDPLLITMIDTPGHTRYLKAQEFGATKGKVGVFCLSIESLLDERFDDSLPDRRTALWFAAHPGQRLIVALTKFDRVGLSEQAYEAAVEKVEGPLPPDRLAAIVPVAIDFARRSGENVLVPSQKMPWYGGPTLIQAIQDRLYAISNLRSDASPLPRNLVFSVEREYPRPLSNAGKIWRVHIENGALATGEAIQLTSVEVKSDLKESAGASVDSISAVVKEFRYDVSIDDEDDEDERIMAYRGSAVTLNLTRCYAGHERISKALVSTTDQTVGLADGEPFSLAARFRIRFETPEDVLWLSGVNQQVVLLSLGRGIPARITGIADDASEVSVELMGGRRLTVPDDARLRALDIFRRVIVRFLVGVDRTLEGDDSIREEERYAYLPAIIDFDAPDEEA